MDKHQLQNTVNFYVVLPRQKAFFVALEVEEARSTCTDREKCSAEEINAKYAPDAD